ncbi:MAG: adenylate/guanylate cyclase domain-containing protein [Pseudooceanicola sp.]|nr:adenylate/guanylate cyclase domain-containing protein [Pseudooceanicola sp.]
MHFARDSVGEQEREQATVAFIDLAGFSAITDIYGDENALQMLDVFEDLVRQAVEGHSPPVKWIGDEVMLAFPDPGSGLSALGRLLTACRKEPRLPLTRTSVHHGAVLRRSGDLFGSTVNIAARLAALAGPGQFLATEAIARVAAAEGISIRALGRTAIRSLPDALPLFDIQLAPELDPAWIDPVCKMYAPFAPFRRDAAEDPWFCSPRCAEAYARSPGTYRVAGNGRLPEADA